PLFAAPGQVGALSLYDTSPLLGTLQELVDFDVINARDVRISVGAVDVRKGNSFYFDTDDPKLAFGPEHVMASGALPPGLPPIGINVIAKLPARLRSDKDVQILRERARHRHISIVHLINRHSTFSTESKDYEFSRGTIRALWDAGRTDMRKTLSDPDWKHACDAKRG